MITIDIITSVLQPMMFFLFYTVTLIFVIFSLSIAYHLFSYSVNRPKVLIASTVYLVISAVLFTSMTILLAIF